MTISANESYLIGNLTFRTDRYLNTSEVYEEAKPLFLPAGTQLFFFSNTKRTGHKDADFSISIKMPIKTAETIINNSKRGSAEWKEANNA
jgi:hypothetical protein